MNGEIFFPVRFGGESESVLSGASHRCAHTAEGFGGGNGCRWLNWLNHFPTFSYELRISKHYEP